MHRPDPNCPKVDAEMGAQSSAFPPPRCKSAIKVNFSLDNSFCLDVRPPSPKQTLGAPLNPFAVQ